VLQTKSFLEDELLITGLAVGGLSEVGGVGWGGVGWGGVGWTPRTCYVCCACRGASRVTPAVQG